MIATELLPAVATAFIVPGPPVAWQRARRRGNRYFTDPVVAAHMDAVRVAWRAAGAHYLGDGPLTVSATFYLDRPRSHYGTGRNAGRLKPSAPAYPTGKPDWDNLVKILDALNGLAFHDDGQIVRALDVAKLYAEPGEQPRSVFELWSSS